MKDSIDYYNIKLDSIKEGMLFNIVKFPRNAILVISYIMILLLILFITGSFIISSVLLFGGLYEYRSVKRTRIKILESCLVDEIMAQDDLKSNGINEEFMHDPLYITDSDRDYFFSDALYNVSMVKYQ